MACPAAIFAALACIAPSPPAGALSGPAARPPAQTPPAAWRVAPTPILFHTYANPEAREVPLRPKDNWTDDQGFRFTGTKVAYRERF